MDIYLVGGAVRDRLLGLTVHERDWVVVGATPDQLIGEGYQQVGKGFPVFLHPKSKEEYALARSEKKVGKGYLGFETFFDPTITLEQDLLRRDLTINAIAEDGSGKLIDPYGGQRDLEDRILRHVSDAFIEDPLRVLRVARFAARFAHLGFRIAKSTLDLMCEISESGELKELTAERIWKEMARALAEPGAVVFFEVLRECGALAEILPELDRLFGVPQPEKHHPEIDTGIHSLLVLARAVELSDDPVVRFAALMHDLGKGETDPVLWPRHIGHEQKGKKLVEQLCVRLTVPKQYRELAIMVTEHHGRCHQASEMRPDTLLKLLESLDLLRRPERLELFLTACIADSRGRTGYENVAYPQAEIVRRAYHAASIPSAKQIVASGFRGEQVGAELRLRRVEAIRRERKMSEG